MIRPPRLPVDTAPASFPSIGTKTGASHELSQARDVLRTESRALEAVAGRLDDSFLQAVDVIAKASGHVVVTGMGKAGLIGQKVAATLCSTGTRAQFLHPAEACHGDLGRVGQGDVLIAFSHSGETAEVNQILGPVHGLGADIIAITSRTSSTLGSSADIAVAYGSIEEACPIGLAPSTSCAVMLAVGDAIAFVLMRRDRFGAEDFGRYHPAGSLGKRLRPVAEVMRSGGQLRLASCRLSVREAFVAVQKPGRRTGAICLVEETGKLAGIFTDSDLARLLEDSDLQQLDRPIAGFMTPKPITAPLRCLVQDLLDLFRLHQVSEIPILDEDGRPVGLVDITDLVDLLPEAA